MTALATTALESLQAQLSAITTANGYPVTVASVRAGRSALAGDASGPFPSIALIPVQDAPEKPEAALFFQTWRRTVELEAILVESDAARWDTQLDDLWDAIRTALTAWAGVLTWDGPAEFFPPADGGGLCGLRVRLSFSYSLRFTE